MSEGEENGPRKIPKIFFEIEKDDKMHAKIVLKIHKVLGRPVFVTNIPGRTALEKVWTGITVLVTQKKNFICSSFPNMRKFQLENVCTFENAIIFFPFKQKTAPMYRVYLLENEEDSQVNWGLGLNVFELLHTFLKNETKIITNEWTEERKKKKQKQYMKEDPCLNLPFATLLFSGFRGRIERNRGKEANMADLLWHLLYFVLHLD